MASALNSNSFLLTSPANSSRPTFKNQRLMRVLAKKAEASSGGEEKANSNPFKLDFGKVPDVKSLIPLVGSSASPGLSFGGASRRKDPNTVFVAGATGQAGTRIAQTLLREGFTVRAGVSDLAAAQELARLAAKYKLISNEESKRVNAVESSFQDPESIAKAIGNASKVVVTIGSEEDGATKAVSASDALNVVQAAELAGVGHVAIIYDGNASNGSTYNVLDGLTSFFTNLFSGSQLVTVQQLLMKIVETNVKYTFIKTSLTQDFSPESGYNVVVLPEGTAGAIDYKVATSQIATVVAKVFSNTAVAENKVVEVSTNPSAPSKSIDDLFSSIPEDGRRAIYEAAQEKAKAEEEAREAAEAAKKLVDKASQKTAEAPEEKPEGGPSVESLLGKAKDIGAGFSWDKLSTQLAAAATSLKAKKEEEETPEVRIATVRGTAKALSLPSLKAIIKPKSSATNAAPVPTKKAKAAPPPPPKRGKPAAGEKKPAVAMAEARSVFGGLFKQETIYIDDD